LQFCKALVALGFWPIAKSVYSFVILKPGGFQNSGGEGRIRTSEGDSRQIYSLFPLTAREPLRRLVIRFRAAGSNPNPQLAAENRKLPWSWRWDSNPQPADYKSAALPIELRQPKGTTYNNNDILNKICYLSIYISVNNFFSFSFPVIFSIHWRYLFSPPSNLKNRISGTE
jgi:hypothetical protein